MSAGAVARALGLIGAIGVIVLPGCWLAFGARLPRATLPTRLAIGVILSPLVVAFQFYALRLIGLPFPTIALVLPVANAPVVWLIGQRAEPNLRPDLRQLALWTAVLLPLAAFLFLWLHDPQVRANWGHAWTHTDIIYMLANGAIRPEEPQLAGIGLAYPWTGHILQGLASFLIGTAPPHNYMLTNAIWLVSTLVMAAAITRDLGGSRLSQAASVLWLCFAVNAVGYGAEHLLPTGLVERYAIWGDWRFTPWLRKFGIFEPTIFGIGMCAALALLLTPRWSPDWKKAPLLLVLLTLCALGVIYPVLFPAGVALVGAKLVAVLWPHDRVSDAARRRYAPLLVATAILAGLVTTASLAWITMDRVSSHTLGLSSPHAIKIKAATTIIVLAPLLLGLAACSRRLWHARRSQLVVLGLGALASVALYVFVDVYNWRNEYKYIFVAAFCLAPFPALAMEPVLVRMGRGATLALALIGLLLFAPAVHKMYAYPADWSSVPIIDTSAFDLRLAPSEPYREIFDAIRRATPTNTVLIARRSDLDLVTLTRRPLYVPYRSEEVHGIGLKADYLLKRSRGYDPQLVEERRRTVRDLFESEDPSNRYAALDRLRQLGRPLAVIVDTDAKELPRELSARGGIEIEEHGGIAAWLIPVDGSE